MDDVNRYLEDDEVLAYSKSSCFCIFEYKGFIKANQEVLCHIKKDFELFFPMESKTLVYFKYKRKIIMKQKYQLKSSSAIGPYNQATAFDKLLFLSGQIPLVPQTMEIIEG